MDFDELIHRTLPNGTVMTYGAVMGNETIVFVKSGRGGDCYGHEDKYLRMAHRIRDGKGYTVICSPNPETEETFEADEAMIREFVCRTAWDAFDLRLLGSSNGAYQILILAERMPETRRVVCVNMPLMINFHKSAGMLSRLAHVDKVFVYGERDQSAPYVPFLNNKRYPAYRLITVQGADHTFEGRTEDFVTLGDLA